jgi:acyl carrier protein
VVGGTEELLCDTLKKTGLEHRTLYVRPNLRTEYVAPRNALEEELEEIWKTVMGFEKIGIDDNFFELGGDSWIALKTMRNLEDITQKKIPAAALFKNPTIRGLAEIISVNGQGSPEKDSKTNKLEDRRSQMAIRNSMLKKRKI